MITTTTAIERWMQEHHTCGADSYSLSRGGNSTTTTIETDNLMTGAYTVRTAATATLSETTSEVATVGTSSVGLTQTVVDVQNHTDTGNVDTGSYSNTLTSSDTTTTQETNSVAASTYTETTTDYASVQDTGNTDTGTFTHKTTDTVITTDNDLYGPLGQQVSVLESSTSTAIATETGNAVSGNYAQTTTTTGNYTMTETSVAGVGLGGSTFTLTETGCLTTTTTETGNSVTAAYTRTQTGSDVYNMVETGTNTNGAFTETVTGTSTPTLLESGNSANQIYSRTITDTDVYTETDAGAGATLSASTTGTVSSTLSETSDARAGLLSQSETGSDRYSLLQNFVNVANTTSGNQPGNMDYLTFGQPFTDPFAAYAVGANPPTLRQPAYRGQQGSIIYEYDDNSLVIWRPGPPGLGQWYYWAPNAQTPTAIPPPTDARDPLNNPGPAIRTESSEPRPLPSYATPGTPGADRGPYFGDPSIQFRAGPYIYGPVIEYGDERWSLGFAVQGPLAPPPWRRGRRWWR